MSKCSELCDRWFRHSEFVIPSDLVIRASSLASAWLLRRAATIRRARRVRNSSPSYLHPTTGPSGFLLLIYARNKRRSEHEEQQTPGNSNHSCPFVSIRGSTHCSTMNASKTKVFVVEDNELMRELLVRQLNRAAHLQCVGACVDAEIALEEIPRLKPDVVLMDIRLPRMNGIECTIRLR